MQKHKNRQGSLPLELEPHWTESDLHEKKISETPTSIIHSGKAAKYFS